MSGGFVRRYDVRTDNVKTKGGWVKLHSIIDIRTSVVLNYTAEYNFVNSRQI